MQDHIYQTKYIHYNLDRGGGIVNAKSLYNVWKSDVETKNIAELFWEPEVDTVLHMDKISITEVTKLEKIIIINLRNDKSQFVFECNNYLKDTDIAGLKVGANNINIHNEINSLMIIITAIDNSYLKTIYCKNAKIIEEKSNCCVIFK